MLTVCRGEGDKMKKTELCKLALNESFTSLVTGAVPERHYNPST